MEWTGFTDEELRRLKSENNDGSTRGRGRGGKRGSGRGGQGRQTPPTTNKARTNNPRTYQITNKAAVNDLPQTMRLSAPPPSEKPQERGTVEMPNDTESKNNISKNTNPFGSSIANDDNTSADKLTNDVEVNDLVVDDSEIMKHELDTLQKFQVQQKQIEEQNKMKKKMLASAIQERQKKAKAESAKLTQITKELGRLDQMLNCDVSIIRDRIEGSSREYMEAQRRFDRAEKEYIAAKIDMHQKQELKEQLTEHLYTIIHQNEMRKAKKLAELMYQLEMEGEEEVEIPAVEMPNLSLFSSVQITKASAVSPTSPNKNIVNDFQSKNSGVEQNGDKIEQKNESVSEQGSESTKESTKEVEKDVNKNESVLADTDNPKSITAPAGTTSEQIQTTEQVSAENQIKSSPVENSDCNVVTSVNDEKDKYSTPSKENTSDKVDVSNVDNNNVTVTPSSQGPETVKS